MTIAMKEVVMSLRYLAIISCLLAPLAAAAADERPRGCTVACQNNLRPTALNSLGGVASINRLAAANMPAGSDGIGGGRCNGACTNNLNPGDGSNAYGTGVYVPAANGNPASGYPGVAHAGVGDANGAPSAIGGNKALTIGSARNDAAKPPARK
ncbi:MAG: hypothetical protein IT562_22830 [Alphaproteobacteria bacterium]|nr:hypothetical protein [Alphaproteobacteria bacterium]